MNLGREKLPWSQETWNRIDQAVHDECQRTRVAAKFLPLYGPITAAQLTIPSDTVLPGAPLNIDETATTDIVEILVEFTHTPQQVAREEELMTAVTLATRATNLLAQGEDLLIFRGQDVTGAHPLFTEGKVSLKSGDAGLGLVNAPASDVQVVKIPALAPRERPQRWGENTFAGIADAYSRLQNGEGLAQAHYGPYASVLHNVPYADTYAPLPTTLIMPADRIKPLVADGLHGTGTLPALTGLFVSLGGNAMDLVMAVDATVAFLQEDIEGNYRFRVFERFTLRLKDTTSVIRLEFENGSGGHKKRR